jgi:hypothetical protein
VRAGRAALAAALTLAGLAALPQASAGAAIAGPALRIDAAHPGAAIDPGVYGASFPTPAFAAAANISLSRWGGNTTTSYDYRSDYWNLGNDWYFENYKAKGSATASLSALDDLVTTAAAAGERAAVTVPVLGWVAKANSDCGFAVSVYGAQQSTDYWRPTCGNGMSTAGTPLAVTRAPSATSLPFGPAEVTGMAQHLAATNPVAPLYYQLDNEPSLWNSTHRDVQPAAVSGTTLFAKSTAAADAILAGDPTARVTGPGDWGWCAYFFFPQDDCKDGADRTAHGGIDLGAAYLQAFAEHDALVGHRTLSVLDEHFYPQGAGIALSAGAGDAATQALRLRSTRALWDPTYADESWIATTGDTAHENVMLIARMKAWVHDYYPGTGLAIGEYNFGALDTMNGALAQADVLGILGREGVRWAALWGPPDTATAPGTFAFRMFRNLDGRGAGFGSTSLPATSADQSTLAVYAATRPDGTLTAVVVNKSAAALTSPVTIDGATLGQSGTRYQYSAAAPTAILTSAFDTSTLGAVTFPASSITTLVLPKVLPGPNLTLRTSSSAVTYPGTATLTVRLTDGSTPVAGASVGFDARVRGTSTWHALTSRTTAADGSATLAVRPSQHMEYSARDLRTLAPGGPHAADTAAVTVLSRRVTTFVLSSRSLRLRSATAAHGRATPSAARLVVTVQRLVKGTWRTYATGRVLAAGTWSLTLRPTARGSYVLRAVVAADATHLAAVSAARTLTVR